MPGCFGIATELHLVIEWSLSEYGADAAPSKLDDGPGQYELMGIVSHMGKNTACGHYVCHLKKKGKWVIYNDEKVAISENPPRNLAYMYLFRRKDVPEQ